MNYAKYIAFPQKRMFARRVKEARIMVKIFRILLICTFALSQTLAPVFAHSFYSYACCHDEDCGAAVLLEEVVGNNGFVTARVFKRIRDGAVATFPEAFKTKQSPDGNWHICVSSTGGLICLYRPLGV